MLRATDEAGNVLPEFEKVLDIDIKAAAEAALGKELTQNLLSVVFDYDGNLWFATGGFRIYPEREQQGVLGYIAHSAIEAILMLPSQGKFSTSFQWNCRTFPLSKSSIINPAILTGSLAEE